MLLIQGELAPLEEGLSKLNISEEEARLLEKIEKYKSEMLEITEKVLKQLSAQ